MRLTPATAGCQVSVQEDVGATHRVVVLRGCRAPASVGISISEDTARDANGNLAGASEPSQTVYFKAPPVVSISAPSATGVRGSGSVSYTVSYEGADSIVLAAAQVSGYLGV